MDIKIKQSMTLPRRVFFFLGSLILLYPLIRFINHHLPRKPKIIEISGSVKQNGYLIKDEFVLFQQDQELWAVTRTCTHLGCRLNYKEKEGILECPCHQSRFTPQGSVIKGPAQKELARYIVEKKGSPPVLTVTVR